MDFSTEDLETFDRRELQNLCKKHGIKANSKVLFRRGGQLICFSQTVVLKEDLLKLLQTREKSDTEPSLDQTEDISVQVLKPGVVGKPIQALSDSEEPRVVQQEAQTAPLTPTAAKRKQWCDSPKLKSIPDKAHETARLITTTPKANVSRSIIATMSHDGRNYVKKSCSACKMSLRPTLVLLKVNN